MKKQWPSVKILGLELSIWVEISDLLGEVVLGESSMGEGGGNGGGLDWL
jgi:hypothetical protein